jgi:hypothetical protein
LSISCNTSGHHWSVSPHWLPNCVKRCTYITKMGMWQRCLHQSRHSPSCK